MSLDPASYVALWSLFDQGGPRPEYVLPVLWAESSFDPTVINSIGCAGVNQACQGLLNQLGVSAATYASWPASQQIRLGLTPYMLAYSPLRSGTRVYQANYLPVTLATARSLSSVLARAGTSYYSSNAGFDTDRKGFITVQDLANSVARAAAQPAVQRAIAAAYALRPNESPQDPVYGQDYSPNARQYVIAASIALLGGAVAYSIHEGTFDLIWEDVDRILHGWSRSLEHWLT